MTVLNNPKHFYSVHFVRTPHSKFVPNLSHRLQSLRRNRFSGKAFRPRHETSNHQQTGCFKLFPNLNSDFFRNMREMFDHVSQMISCSSLRKLGHFAADLLCFQGITGSYCKRAPKPWEIVTRPVLTRKSKTSGSNSGCGWKCCQCLFRSLQQRLPQSQRNDCFRWVFQVASMPLCRLAGWFGDLHQQFPQVGAHFGRSNSTKHHFRTSYRGLGSCRSVCQAAQVPRGTGPRSSEECCGGASRWLGAAFHQRHWEAVPGRKISSGLFFFPSFIFQMYQAGSLYPAEAHDFSFIMEELFLGQSSRLQVNVNVNWPVSAIVKRSVNFALHLIWPRYGIIV